MPAVRHSIQPALPAENRGRVFRTPAPVPRLTRWVPLTLVWVVAALYLGTLLDRGWVPHDEGLISQTAERVLLGELPHRDFTEVYTGGLTYAHALAFRLLGANLMSPRLLMFAVFLVWVPALYYLISRFVRPVPAAGLTLLAVVWSVPCYPVSLPSWYNLYLATFGTAALLRYADTERRPWLVVAGLCGGLSFLVKVVGLYFLAGALLFFVYREQCEARREPLGGKGGRAYSLVVTASLALFVALLVALVARTIDPPTVVHFVLPGTALAGALAVREWALPGPDGRRRFARLLGDVGPFLAGAALPIALFFVWYAAQGALPSLVEGVFVLPQLRLSIARWPLPPLSLTIPFTGVLLLLVVPAALAREREARWLALLLSVIGALVIVTSATNRFVYTGVWLSLRLISPLLVIAGALLLMRADESWARRRTTIAISDDADDRATVGGGKVSAEESAGGRQRAVLVLAMLATCTLSQFPFSSEIYFTYVTPFVVVGAVGFTSLRRPIPVAVGGVLVATFIGFAVLRIRPAALSGVGIMYRPAVLTGRLDGPRGANLRVRQRDADDVQRMVAAVAAHSPPGSYIYATPDCPEVYFLSGMRNPTPTIYDIFDEPAGREARILRAIEAHDVRVVVINSKPSFSGPVSPELSDSLAARFPQTVGAGRYAVRWRE